MATTERAHRRDQILQVAATLFSERGYHGTSMQDLAEGLGILRGSLYAHIDSKEDLLFQIVDEGADRFIARMSEVTTSDRDPSEKLRAGLLAHITTVAEHLDASTVFLNDWRLLSPARRKQIGKKRERYEGLVSSIIEEGIEKGSFRSDLDPRFAVLTFLSTVNWLYQWYDPKGPLDAQGIADKFSEILINGFASQPRKRSQR